MSTCKVDLIHVGFPKTATTWLQQHVIMALPDVKAIGKPYNVDLRFRQVLNDLVSQNDLEFDAAAFQQKISCLCKENALDRKDAKVVLSFELLTGNLYTGENARQLLQRLSAVFGRQANIVVTVREQTSIIESLYKHYVTAGGSLHIRDFLLASNSPCVDAFGNKRLLEKFRYDKYLESCRDIFGDKNVEVMFYEEIDRKNPEKFIARFCKLIDIPESAAIPQPTGKTANDSLSPLCVMILRYINKIFPSPHNDAGLLLHPLRNFYLCFVRFVMRPLDLLIFRHFLRHKKFVNVKARWFYVRFYKKVVGKYNHETDGRKLAQLIRDAYRPSNRALQKMLGTKLKKYGYAV